MDIFEDKSLTPMLIGKNSEPFDSEDCIFELKFDGVRCLVYTDGLNTEIYNKRNKQVTSLYPELSHIHKQIKGTCVLDGEVLIIKDGKPNFSEMQKRSLMTNPFKIKLASQKLPVTFVAFDILYRNGKDLTKQSLIKRKEILKKYFKDTRVAANSKFIEKEGIKFFELAKSLKLEGIVAKKKDGKYYFGKRTDEWIKIKALEDEDFIICGYCFKSDSKTTATLLLAQYVDKKLKYQAHAGIHVNNSEYKIITSQTEVLANYYKDFPNYGKTMWLKPVLVCKVEFMERTSRGGLRQPVYRGLRDDKTPKECVKHD